MRKDKEKNRKYHREYARLRFKDPEFRRKRNELARKNRKAQKESNFPKYQAMLRDRHLRKDYGITVEIYDALLSSQGFKCANTGCNRLDSGIEGRRFSIDHDHSCCDGTKSCGKCIRGLLCSSCNLILGHCKDKIELLNGLVEYLNNRKKH